MLREEFGVEDGWPVPGEPFTQWVVEDDFPAGRPALETVGVQFVPDVGPYELMKLRLLNASHQAIAYLGGLLGHVYVDEAMRDQGLRDYLMAHMIREAAPTLEDLPGIDLDAYMRTLIERFSNPRIRDTLNRLATDGANRMATFTLPVIRANLDAGRPVGLGAAMVAAWAHYWERISLGDTPPAGRPDDVHAPEMVAAAGRQAAEPMAFIGMRSLFGDLGSRRAFTDAFLSARASLLADGVHATLHRLLSPR
jgi:mannitol 2-dehydrogenase